MGNKSSQISNIDNNKIKFINLKDKFINYQYNIEIDNILDKQELENKLLNCKISKEELLSINNQLNNCFVYISPNKIKTFVIEKEQSNFIIITNIKAIPLLCDTFTAFVIKI